MAYSVLDSSLFPAGMSAGRYAAVTGGGGERSKREIPVIRESADGLRIVYERPMMEMGESRPGKAVDLEEYLDDLLQGFDFAYEYLQRIHSDAGRKSGSRTDAGTCGHWAWVSDACG